MAAVKLSIIIPFYNTEEYTDQLLQKLEPQVTKECEVIIVDDGSKKEYDPWQIANNIIVLRHLSNKGVSAARNTGLKKAKGEYIAFIDSDDMVSEDYIEQILKAIETDPDTVYLSWKSMDGKFGKTIKTIKDEFGPKNRCVWNRVFKKEYISGIKFDENMQVAEDDDFLNHLPKVKSHTFVSHPIYFYRVGRENGLSVRKARGEFDEPDITTQVVLYYNWVQEIGGVETFFYNFCSVMTKYYDIAILYDRCDMRQIQRLRHLVPCYHNGDYKISCDTLIINGIFDKIPQKVDAKRKIRLVHTCRIEKYKILNVPKDCDETIFVSNASRESFDEEGTVISNMPGDIKTKKALILISATRLTNEKGYDRMLKLADKFKKNNVPFIWFVFTAHNDKTFPEGFVKLPPTLDIKPYIAKADYLVQLSDVEAFCYSIQEALQLKVPVLSTPIKALPEVGFKTGENGYIVPFNIEEMTDEAIQNIHNKIPKCKTYVHDTEFIIHQWQQVLGNTVPTHSYKYDESMVTIKCKVRFNDVILNRHFNPGQIQTVDAERGKYLVEELKAWEYV